MAALAAAPDRPLLPVDGEVDMVLQDISDMIGFHPMAMLEGKEPEEEDRLMVVDTLIYAAYHHTGIRDRVRTLCSSQPGLISDYLDRVNDLPSLYQTRSVVMAVEVCGDSIPKSYRVLICDEFDLKSPIMDLSEVPFVFEVSRDFMKDLMEFASLPVHRLKDEFILIQRGTKIQKDDWIEFMIESIFFHESPIFDKIQGRYVPSIPDPRDRVLYQSAQFILRGVGRIIGVAWFEEDMRLMKDYLNPDAKTVTEKLFFNSNSIRSGFYDVITYNSVDLFHSAKEMIF
jgi:hypothetical protein